MVIIRGVAPARRCTQGGGVARAHSREMSMQTDLAQWSLILLCLSMSGSFGGGLYEHIVLTPLWSASPPRSFTVIQPGTGVPLQRFWIPIHAAITLSIFAALF